MASVFSTITISSTYLLEILSLYNLVLAAAINQEKSNTSNRSKTFWTGPSNKSAKKSCTSSKDNISVNASMILRFSWRRRMIFLFINGCVSRICKLINFFQLHLQPPLYICIDSLITQKTVCYGMVLGSFRVNDSRSQIARWVNHRHWMMQILLK